MNKILQQYATDIKRHCDTLDLASISSALELIEAAYHENRQIFIAGNGGSAATANHFSCDFSKNAVKNSERKPKLISLSTNIEYLTAIGNDIDYNCVFSKQLQNLMNDGDLVILISASGNSPNVVNAAEYAKSKNGKLISLTGFDGGHIGKISDVSINVPVNSYEQAEDMHMIILHMFVSHFKALGL